MAKLLRRWIIEGTLTTLTPLHIGDGGAISRENWEFLLDKNGNPVEIQSVATNFIGRAYLPASPVKGNLRSWAQGKIDESLFNVIFGSKETDLPNAVSGKVQFFNAYVAKEPEITTTYLPAWDAARLTAVNTSIAVDRQRKTASDQKLFHQEFVPPGISFSFCLAGNDFDNEDEHFQGENLWTELLALLSSFSQAEGVSLGSDSSNLKDGWGNLIWSLSDIRFASESHIANWIANGCREAGYEICSESLSSKDALQANAINLATLRQSSTNYLFDVDLECVENFLVNDPSRAKQPSERNDITKTNHIGLRNKDGKPLLTKSSLKGAVRSQAERILRTIAVNQGLSDDLIIKRIACFPDNPKKSCRPIKKYSEVKTKLCLACQIFGASGWKSPFQASPFISESQFEEKQQEFVAIDRFTGGGAEGAKFNAKSFRRQTPNDKFILKGQFSIKKEIEDWAVGLLAFTFKDLIESDIRIGFGSSKGYGEVIGKLNNEIDLTKIFEVEKAVLIEKAKSLEKEIEEVGRNGVS